MLCAVMRLTLRCLLLPLVVVLVAPLPSGRAADGDTRPPVPFRLSRPAYPESLLAHRIRGEVRLAFDIDEHGYVNNVEVVYATHPDFIPPALKVTENWRYRAALQDGKPVPTRWKETLFTDVVSRGADPFSIPEKAPADLPTEVQYDLPPSIETVAPVVYPYDAMIDGREGSADVAFLVDADGRPRDITVRKASRPEFGHALAAAMAQWRFKPAMKNGQPSPALLTRGQQFGTSVEHLLLTDSARRVREVLIKSKEDIVPFNRLDPEPKPLERTAPAYPEKHLGKPGKAEIEIIIDREGNAQLPRIVSSSAPEFGWAAATAISSWRFEPPRRDGKPVDARVRVPMDFTPSRAEVAAATAEEGNAPPDQAPPADQAPAAPAAP